MLKIIKYLTGVTPYPQGFMWEDDPRKIPQKTGKMPLEFPSHITPGQKVITALTTTAAASV